jgi:hypothetical protein
VESPQYDHAYIRVSNDGVNWTTFWTNGLEITDNTWNQIPIDISDVADNQETVYIRWTMGTTDGGWRYCGWNIDDVEIYAIENVLTATNELPQKSDVLLTNYPNPFSVQTLIEYELVEDAKVTLNILDLNGKLVKTLVDQPESAGIKQVTWDARNESGNQVETGIYIYQLKVGNRSLGKKMLLSR